MNKAVIILTVKLFLVSFLFGQSFEIHVADSVKTGQPGDEIELGGELINLTAAEIEIVMTRVTNEIPSDWTTSLCFDGCAPPWIDQMTGTVAPGDTLEFSIHFFTGQTPGQGQAQLELSQGKVQTVSVLFKAKTNGSSGVLTSPLKVPDYQLLQNFPNPFNSTTKIKFHANQGIRNVRLRVFSISGEIVHERWVEITNTGFQNIIFSAEDLNGRELPSGMYFYRLDYFSNQGFVKTQTSRFLLVK